MSPCHFLGGSIQDIHDKLGKRKEETGMKGERRQNMRKVIEHMTQNYAQDNIEVITHSCREH